MTSKTTKKFFSSGIQGGADGVGACGRPRLTLGGAVLDLRDGKGRRCERLLFKRIWRAHGLQPHRVRQFKLSNDPQFVPKLRDVLGLFVNPTAGAVVLSLDEKS